MFTKGLFKHHYRVCLRGLETGDSLMLGAIDLGIICKHEIIET